LPPDDERALAYNRGNQELLARVFSQKKKSSPPNFFLKKLNISAESFAIPTVLLKKADLSITDALKGICFIIGTSHEVKMLLAWMISATILYSLSLLLWFGLFALSFLAFDAGTALGPVLFVTAYAPLTIGTMIWAWIKYRKLEGRHAGLIMLLPLAYVVLFYLFPS